MKRKKMSKVKKRSGGGKKIITKGKERKVSITRRDFCVAGGSSNPCCLKNADKTEMGSGGRIDCFV